MEVTDKLRALAERWAGARPAERANAQPYRRELAEALRVGPPRLSRSGALLARFRRPPIVPYY